jgi:UDPglucose 6-dehydrogenase
MREAPSIKIINRLIAEGAKVSAYDPKAMESAKTILGDKIEYSPTVEECVDRADCCLLVTEWATFKELTPGFFKSHMTRPVLIDGRRIYDVKTYSEELEFAAIGLG